MYDNKNRWDEFEYDKLKLLCHMEKVRSIMDVSSGRKEYDGMMPISVELHLTDSCNLACPWCTDKDLLRKGNQLSKDVVLGLLKEFGSYSTGVTLEGGGEPTIYPHFKEIVEYGFRNNVSLGLITNGTLDFSDVINMFRWVRISLDSSNREEYIAEKGKDCFEQVMTNLERYKEIRDNRSCYLGIGYVVTRRNYNDIDKVVQRLDELGVDYIYLRPVEEAEDLSPTREELYDLRKRLLKLTDGKRIKFKLVINDRLTYDNDNLPCVCHSLASIIHANGDVFCCEKRRHDEIKFGNVNDSSFSEIWWSGIRKDTTAKLLNAENQKGCSVCRITAFNKIISNLEKINTREFI